MPKGFVLRGNSRSERVRCEFQEDTLVATWRMGLPSSGPVASHTHLDLEEQAGQGAEPAARGPTWLSGGWEHSVHVTVSLAAISHHSVIFKLCSKKGSPAFPKEASGGRQGSPPQRERWGAGKSLLTSGGHMFLPGVL